ncbi:Ig-like domain-containing protein [Humidisolicoccus flavus]|uniref:Ig-like domain-containing protein n=1 Tax=Humidisolicoccus flavus TaxID=3111414 RepID=UPI003245FB0A
MRRLLRGAALILASGMLLLGNVPLAGAYSGPNAVEIPYLGETNTKPAEGWLITDCAPVLAASDLVTACTSEQIDFAATAYEPDFNGVTIPVPLSNGVTSLVIEYLVTLAPPEAPTIGLTSYRFPVAAGSVFLLPLSDLAIECVVCVEGGAVQVLGVEPAEAGEVGVTSEHLVFRPAQGFVGAATIGVRFADDYGTWSQPASVEIPVYRPGGEPLIAQSVYAQLFAADSTSLQLPPLVVSDDPSSVRVVGCGAAIHGTVICTGDGAVQYVPFEEAAVDQFSYHVAGADGEQATGSVTLVAEAGELPTIGIVPADVRPHGKDESVTTSIVPKIPPAEDAEASNGGAFAAFTVMLNRLGAE